jgi:hypothetical protein
VRNEILVLVHNSLLLLSVQLERQEGIRDEKVERKFEALALRAAWGAHRVPRAFFGVSPKNLELIGNLPWTTSPILALQHPF